MAPNIVEVLLRLKGARAFASESAQASGAIKKTGDEVDKADKKLRRSHAGMKMAAVGLGGIGAGAALVKSSVTQVENLGRASLGLMRSTGMDLKTASSWSEAAKVRGLQASKLQIGFKTLAKQIDQAAHGSKTSLRWFNDLGVSMTDIASGNMQNVLLQVSDGISKMGNHAQKTAAVTTMFGKSGMNLFGILNKGSAGIKEMLERIQDLGAYLPNMSEKQLKNLIKRHQELSLLWDGVKIKIGTAVMPALVKLGDVFFKFIGAIDSVVGRGNGMLIVFGSLAALFGGAAFVGALMTLAPAIAAIGGAIMTTLMPAILSLVIATAPISLTAIAIVAGIALLIAGFVLLYTKVKWFRDAIGNAWKFIRDHWKLLASIILLAAGPLGIIAILFINFWKQIKQGAIDAWQWIRNAFNNVIRFLGSVPGQLAKLGGKMWGWIKTGLVSVLAWVVNLWNKTWGHIFGKVDIGPKKRSRAGRGVSGGAHAGPIRAAGLAPGLSPSGAPRMQSGGTLTAAGMALVGEGGPELLSLPRAASVVPLGLGAQRSLEATPAQSIITKVFLDKRQIAEAVGTHTADKIARK